MRPVIYIAGPISDPDTCVIFKNLSQFFWMEVKLWQQGYAVINPASDIIAAIMHGNFTWHDFLEKDKPLVTRSDVIYMLPGWENSPGATAEAEWAADAGVVRVETIEMALYYLDHPQARHAASGDRRDD